MISPDDDGGGAQRRKATTLEEYSMTIAPANSDIGEKDAAKYPSTGFRTIILKLFTAAILVTCTSWALFYAQRSSGMSLFRGAAVASHVRAIQRLTCSDLL
jgi:hypothetical protein